MKHTFLIVVGFCLMQLGFTQGLEFSTFQVSEQVPYWFLANHKNLKVPGNYIVSDYLNPLYFEEDFNGDGDLDIALAIQEKENLWKGILIIHGGTLEAYVMGAGIEFGDLKNLDWMQVWWIYREDSAQETQFSEDFDIIGSETVPLERVAIRVGQFESTSNLIYWNGSDYIWIHTGD